MAKRNYNKSDILIFVLIFSGGIALTAISVCLDIVCKPRSTIALVLICIIDFLYAVFSSAVILKIENVKVWRFLGCLLPFGHIGLFMAVALLFTAFYANAEFFKSHILTILLYAIFTQPSMFVFWGLIGGILQYS